jgi:hypothetical protein
MHFGNPKPAECQVTVISPVTVIPQKVNVLLFFVKKTSMC